MITRAAPVIAVVSHNSLSELRDRFPSQVELARALGSTVVAVDNASTDGSAEFLRSRQARGDPVRAVTLPANEGYAAAVNRAFAEAPGRDVLLLNPDVEAGLDAARGLIGLLDSDPRAGVIGPGLLYPEGGVQPSARRPASLAALLGSLPGLRAVGPLRARYERFLWPVAGGDAAAVDWVIGAAMLIRRRAFDDVGGWDSRYFLYMEDADFCRRCARAGWRVVYLPAATMTHGYRRASSQGGSVLSSPDRRKHMRSLVRYWSRHPGAMVGLAAARRARERGRSGEGREAG